MKVTKRPKRMPIDYMFPSQPSKFTALNQGATCCPDKHQTFYGAIVRNPLWEAWNKEAHKQGWDWDESTGIGCISDAHLTAFLHFVAANSHLIERQTNE